MKIKNLAKVAVLMLGLINQDQEAQALMSTAKLQAKADKRQVLELQALRLQIIHICHQQQTYEETCTHGYDTKASIMAICNFRQRAANIEAHSAQQLLTQLQGDTKQAQQNCQNPGQYNGGIGRYGSLINKVNQWYETQLPQMSNKNLWLHNFYLRNYHGFINSDFFDHLRFQYHYEKTRWSLILLGTGLLGFGGFFWIAF